LTGSRHPARFWGGGRYTQNCGAKVNLDIFWLKDHALDDPDLLPPPDEVAAEIVESLEAALDRFRNVAKALGEGPI
jgi:hypothetical protein